MKVVAIWNSASGNAPDEDELRDALGPEVTLVATTEDDPGPGQTADAVNNGATTVVACGGDGTIRACIEPLLSTETALDIVPLGTGNLLAGNLAIPAGLEAGEQAGRRDRTMIDVGFVNGEAFAVMAGSGFDAAMIRDADDKTKSRFGRLAYVTSAAKHLNDSLTATSVEVDGRKFYQGRTSMVLVGNFGVVSGGLPVFPDARPDDGVLDVAVLAAERKRDWASVLWRLLRNKHQRPELVRRATGAEITVTTSQPRPYELDGEDRPETRNLEFSVRPRALSIHHGPGYGA